MKTVNENVLSEVFTNATAQKKESLWDWLTCLTFVLQMLAVLPVFDYIVLYAPTLTHLKFSLNNNPILKKEKSFRKDNVKTWCDFAMRSSELQIDILKFAYILLSYWLNHKT